MQKISVAGSLLVVSLAISCQSSPDIQSMLLAFRDEQPNQKWHVGPDVYIADTGTARFVLPLLEAFDLDRATKTLTFVDQFYRAPGNRGYDAVVDRIEENLRAAGFGGDDPRLELEIIETEQESDAWTPLDAKLTLLADGEGPRVLHAFDSGEDVDRVMLPIHAPSCSVEGEIALHLDDLKKGMILVTDVRATQVLRRATARGASAILSASLGEFNVDPTGQERHLDAIQFRTMPATNTMPVAQISGRTLQVIEAAVERGAVRNRPVRIHFDAHVLEEKRPLRTIVATIRGAKSPEKAVAIVSHIQEPGANDNASGVSGLLESARSLSDLIRSGGLPWPDSSVVFIWGDEFSQSQIWLDKTDLTPIVGISSDMTGENQDTGARALLERMPDPGAITPLPPDAHTPWGAGEVDSENLNPNGFSIIARCAMVDVGLAAGGWHCADHPWEGGSDHDVFINRGIPAVLFWHFTDFTYHTGLDRLDFVDVTEIRRTAAAILATALAVAAPQPEDLDRYLRSLDMDKTVRIDAAREVEDEGLEAMWKMWADGSRNWLRKLCLGIDENLPAQSAAGSEG